MLAQKTGEASHTSARLAQVRTAQKQGRENTSFSSVCVPGSIPLPLVTEKKRIPAHYYIPGMFDSPQVCVELLRGKQFRMVNIFY